MAAISPVVQNTPHFWDNDARWVRDKVLVSSELFSRKQIVLLIPRIDSLLYRVNKLCYYLSQQQHKMSN